jgi:hypothetical protein
MVRWLEILLGTLRSTVRTHRELALENLALPQQLAVWKARQPRPRLTALDRIFWVVPSRLWKNWQNSLRVVRPTTVVVAPAGFRRYWAWKSRRPRGRPAVGTELRDLIRRMSHANPLWGTPRIHGELLKLGLTVSQATVSAFFEDLKRRGLPDPLLAVTDGAPGLLRAVETCFPRALRQRCLVHRLRNLRSKAPETMAGDRDPGPRLLRGRPRRRLRSGPTKLRIRG